MSDSRNCSTTCPYCGVGCGVDVTLAKSTGWQATDLKGTQAHPANQGRLCVKGSALLDAHVMDGRLLSPQVNGQEVDWKTAIDAVASGFQETIARYGPDSVAVYLSGQLLTEDYYVANKLMKGFVGSRHVDTNSRLCMASTVAAYRRAFGEDVVPCQYEDIEQAELVVLVGSNAAWTHPVVYQRLLASKQSRPRKKIVVIDPRRTSTCDGADLHLPLTPGSDVSLYNGLLAFLVAEGRLDVDYIEQHTEGFEALAATLPKRWSDTTEATGLTKPLLRKFYSWFAETDKVVTLFSQGVNQAIDGTSKASSIIHAHLATGKIGGPGQGPFSLTGQPNAMGGREVGGMANQLAAHMDYTEEDKDRVRRFWSAPNLCDGPGYKAVEMFEAVGRGDIKAIWIMGTNPVVSLPDASSVKAALAGCPLVVLSDCMQSTDTAAYADVLLPAAAWGEKDGTVTNSERCISRQRAFRGLPGDALPDWRIIRDVAVSMGNAEAFGYASPRDVFVEHAGLSGFENAGERLFDISHFANLSNEEYDQMSPTCWPLTGRPFANGRYSTPNGRAHFSASPVTGTGQRVSDQFPLILNTGRLRDQWHTMTRTGKAPALLAHTPEPRVQLNPLDAAKYAVLDQNLVDIENDQGRVKMLADVTTDVPEGSVFTPIHWCGDYAGSTIVSDLVEAVVDPVSGQPESKHAVVRIAPAQVSWWVRVVSSRRLDPDSLGAAGSFWFAVETHAGWFHELALIHDPTKTLPFSNADIVFEDSVDMAPHIRLSKYGDERFAWLASISPVRDALLSKQKLFHLLETQGGHSWRKVSTLGSAPLDESKLICSCFETTQKQIESAIGDGAMTLKDLSGRLRCGTNCGSCVPELNQQLVQLLEQQRAAS